MIPKNGRLTCTNLVSMVSLINILAFSKLIEGNEGRYCIGDEITIADLCLVPQLYNARRHGIDIEKDFPHLFKIDQELQKVPEIAAAHPYKQPDYPGPN